MESRIEKPQSHSGTKQTAPSSSENVSKDEATASTIGANLLSCTSIPARRSSAFPLLYGTTGRSGFQPRQTRGCTTRGPSDSPDSDMAGRILSSSTSSCSPRVRDRTRLRPPDTNSTCVSTGQRVAVQGGSDQRDAAAVAAHDAVADELEADAKLDQEDGLGADGHVASALGAARAGGSARAPASRGHGEGAAGTWPAVTTLPCTLTTPSSSVPRLLSLHSLRGPPPGALS
eukprot:1502896-Rhodomonas_salina.1